MSGLNDTLPAWLFDFVPSETDKINILLVLCVMLFMAVVVVAVRRRKAEQEVTEIYRALGQFADCIERIESRQRKLGQDVAALLQQNEKGQAPEGEEQQPAEVEEPSEPRAATVHHLGVGLKQLRDVMAQDAVNDAPEKAQAAE